MANRIEQEGIPIRSKEDVAEINGVAEQQFALLLLDHPNLSIVYEPRLFEHTNGDGRLEGTLPDFYVYNKKSKRGTYVEITNAEYTDGKDPKEKQRRVMQAVAQKDRYTVLYGQNLRKIQRAHPQYKFSNGTKIK